MASLPVVQQQQQQYAPAFIDLTREEPEIPVTEEKGETVLGKRKDAPKSSLCLQTLMLNISCLLEGRVTAHFVASSIAATNPEILLDLVGYSKQELLKEIEPYLPETSQEKGRARSAILILYTIALRNSRHNETTVNLEPKIAELLGFTKSEYIRGLIARGEAALGTNVEETEESVGYAIQLCSSLLTEVGRAYDLFYYVDPGNKGRIEVLYTYTKIGGHFVFPNCRRHFPTFCQNLSILGSERNALSRIRRDLVRKLEVAQKLRAELRRQQEPKISRDRALVLEHHARTLWNAATQFIRHAFQVTIERKTKKRLFLPQPFVGAVNACSLFERQRSRTFNILIGRSPPPLSDQFICEVFGRYMGENVDDFADFMKLFVLNLREREFQSLQRDLQDADHREQRVEQLLMNYFNGCDTFMGIRSWAERVRT